MQMDLVICCPNGMVMRLWLSLLLLVPMVSLAQLDTTPHINGQRIIWDEPEYSPGSFYTLVGNPEFMHDMIIIDSLGNKILERTSTELGYACYHWTSSGIKIYEDIGIDTPYFKLITFWDSSGHKVAHWIINWRDSSRLEIFYYRDEENVKRSYVEKSWVKNIGWQILGNKYEFHKNGNIKAKGGYQFKELLAPEACKDGVWEYFNAEGKLIREETYRDCELARSVDYEEP